MAVRKAGRRVATSNWGSPGSPQIYDYKSPSVTFESDKLTDEEIEKFGGEIKIYNIKDLNPIATQ